MKNSIPSIVLQIMNLEQRIDDGVKDNGCAYSNEELDALYSELQKLHMLKYNKKS